jgi:RNA polymerase sigma factor (sigma-70 family)
MSIQDTSAQNGARLNYLYQQFQQQPGEASQNALFGEIQNYASRIVTDFAKKESVNTLSFADSVQDACLKVFQKQDTFKSKSKFSTWVFSIVRSAFYDALRKDFRRGEVSLDARRRSAEMTQ